MHLRARPRRRAGPRPVVAGPPPLLPRAGGAPASPGPRIGVAPRRPDVRSRMPQPSRSAPRPNSPFYLDRSAGHTRCGGSISSGARRALCATTMPVTTATPPTSATASKVSREPDPAQRADPDRLEHRHHRHGGGAQVPQRQQLDAERQHGAHHHDPGEHHPDRGGVLAEAAEQADRLAEQVHGQGGDRPHQVEADGGVEERPQDHPQRVEQGDAVLADQEVRREADRGARRRRRCRPRRRPGRARCRWRRPGRPRPAPGRATAGRRTGSRWANRAHSATRMGAWYSSSSAIPTGSRSMATK